MVTVSWGQGLSEDGREVFDSVESARSMLEHDSDLSPEELDRLFGSLLMARKMAKGRAA